MPNGPAQLSFTLFLDVAFKGFASFIASDTICLDDVVITSSGGLLSIEVSSASASNTVASN